MFNINLGKFLAQLRVENKLTQEKLAEMLHIDKRKISRWECGMSIPDFDMLIRLSEILDVSLYELSICEKIEDKSIPRSILNKFKNIKDFKRYKLKKKIIFIISILIRLFFIFTAIYTLKFYGSVDIYKIISVDDEYVIKGTYIHAGNYNSYEFNNLSYKKNQQNIISNPNNCEYEIYDNDMRIAQFQAKNSQVSDIPYTDFFKKISSDKTRNELNDNSSFKLHITCSNHKKITDEYKIDIQFIKKFDNRLF